jgi:hypothetical protein
MSDFKNISDFRKGSISKYPYQDPTYLSFAILFDVFNPALSPLLAGPAEDYLKKLAESGDTIDNFYKEAYASFIEFKKALLTINNEMPWYWQSIKGLERLFQRNDAEPYFGGDDAKIEIETLESLNLPVAGLMHLYREGVFDSRRWGYILPTNLRKFTMYVYVTEVRSIQVNTDIKVNGIPSKINKDAINGFPDNFKPKMDTENKNSAIMGTDGRPYFMVGIKYCEFDMMTGTAIFSDLSKNPENAAVNNITINYQGFEKIEARVLNGIITEPEHTKNHMSPSPDSEFFESSSKTPMEFAKDKLNGRLSEANERGKATLKSLAEDKKRELAQELRIQTVNRIPTFENVFSNVVRNIDNATDITQQQRNIGNNIQANVFGNFTGSSITQGLNAAAQNGVRNLGNAYD